MWLTVAVVCLLPAPQIRLSISADSEWPHNALLYHYIMPIIPYLYLNTFNCRLLWIMSTYLLLPAAYVTFYIAVWNLVKEFAAATEYVWRIWLIALLFLCLDVIRYSTAWLIATALCRRQLDSSTVHVQFVYRSDSRRLNTLWIDGSCRAALIGSVQTTHIVVTSPKYAMSQKRTHFVIAHNIAKL